MQDLNAGTMQVTLLETNTGSNLQGLGFGNECLEMIPKSQTIITKPK